MFKVGDKLICKEGFLISRGIDDKQETDGGAGYKVGRIIIVNNVSSLEHGGRAIVWPTENPGLGIYFQALSLLKEKMLKPRIKLKFGR